MAQQWGTRHALESDLVSKEGVKSGRPRRVQRSRTRESVTHVGSEQSVWHGKRLFIVVNFTRAGTKGKFIAINRRSKVRIDPRGAAGRVLAGWVQS